MTTSPRKVSLQDFFSGLAESTFQSRLGVADPPLIGYLADLLVRFVRFDAIYSVRDLAGRCLDQVALMVQEADNRQGEARREAHRHIGDFTLFWSGVYPEAIERMQAVEGKDPTIDFGVQGKRAYYIASTIRSDENARQCEILERISHEFDLCAYGLGEVRREWERRDERGQAPPIWLVL